MRYEHDPQTARAVSSRFVTYLDAIGDDWPSKGFGCMLRHEVDVGCVEHRRLLTKMIVCHRWGEGRGEVE